MVQEEVFDNGVDDVQQTFRIDILVFKIQKVVHIIRDLDHVLDPSIIRKVQENYQDFIAATKLQLFITRIVFDVVSMDYNDEVD